MVLCVVPLYAHRIYGKHLSHCAPGLCVSFFSSCFRVALNRSTIPSVLRMVWGGPDLLNTCYLTVSLHGLRDKV